MKKNMLFVLLLISSASFAQHFELGLKAGANASNFNGASNTADLKATTLIGFHAGAFVSLFVGNNFAIQPEVLFSTQGAKLESTGTDKTDYHLDYINVPVMLKFRTDGGFYLEAGPQVGFKVHETHAAGTTEDFAKSTDLAIAGGLGYHSPIGLGIGARYVAGLSKIGDINNNTRPDWKNGTIQVSVFYTLFNNHRK